MFSSVVFACGLLLVYVLVFSGTGSQDDEKAISFPEDSEHGTAAPPSSIRRLEDIPFNGQRAYEYLKLICKLGPRISGTPGMRRQQEVLQTHFEGQGGEVEMQRFEARHPLTRKAVPMANMIVHWRPERTRRVLLCAHYDTRPLPDRDPNPRKRTTGVFLGANDGASGVALLMEMGSLMREFEGPVGVDFLLVDGEELVYEQGWLTKGTYFLGSQWFAQQYANSPPEHKYVCGVVLDMIADAGLQIHPERHSARWQDTRPIVRQIWDTAERLGVREFHPRPKYEVKDDHLMLRNIGRIPTVDIIDFDYGRDNRYWHTEADLPNKCSALSLAKVGWVIHEWLKTVE